MLWVVLTFPTSIPFDFDFSGLVNTRYATPDPSLPIRRVRQRLFRGFCPGDMGRDPEEYEAVYELFREKKEEIYDAWRAIEGLERDRLEETLEYFDDFYDEPTQRIFASVLERHGWRGAFAIRTDSMNATDWATAKELEYRGHLMINHGQSHLTADGESAADIEADIRLGKHEVPSRAYVGAFNFRGADQQKKVGQLSGGERNRLHLAKMLKEGANVILLDEPTNDLDVDTLRELEEALLEFAGVALITSQDRWFLDRVATHILAFEGESQVQWFEGNYQDYEADRRRRLGAEADQPHRIRYKRLSR